MDTNCTAPPASATTWGVIEIATIANMCLTVLVTLINLHQSYRHKHLRSTCFGREILVCDSETAESDAAPPLADVKTLP